VRSRDDERGGKREQVHLGKERALGPGAAREDLQFQEFGAGCRESRAGPRVMVELKPLPPLSDKRLNARFANLLRECE
jgi:hypothetical protein